MYVEHTFIHRAHPESGYHELQLLHQKIITLLRYVNTIHQFYNSATYVYSQILKTDLTIYKTFFHNRRLKTAVPHNSKPQHLNGIWTEDFFPYTSALIKV